MFSISLKHRKIFFLLPFLFLTNPAYADSLNIETDWLIEGQTIENTNSVDESNIQQAIIDNLSESEKIVYDKFVTNNKYSIGDYKITIDSEEGQILNGLLIEQQTLQEDSFKHKIKYYDRFSDGYIEIAEALLDPVGEQRYLINGRAFDHYPSSNMEYFLLERGYDLENLQAIPNDVFSPAALDKARELIVDSQLNGGNFDLNEISPNYMRIDEDAMQERIMNSISEQTSQIFDEIMTGKKLQPDGTLSDIEVMISKPQGINNMFDDFKFNQPKFENTRHVIGSIQDGRSSVITTDDNLNELSFLLIIPVFVALAVFGYLMSKKLNVQKQSSPLLEVIPTPINYQKITKDMLNNSLNLSKNNQRKEAHELLSQAIRFYYSKKLEINREITNYELLEYMKNLKVSEINEIRSWLLLCGSVEYAQFNPNDDDFANALSRFSSLIDKD